MIPFLKNPIDHSCTPTGVIGSSGSDGFSVTSSSGERNQQRPLSGYNIFFILHRKRILDGEVEDRFIALEEVKECMENQILLRNLPRPKRMHRKTHGKMGFREMARALAKKWKRLTPLEKQMYNHCADSEKNKQYKTEKKQETLNPRNVKTTHDTKPAAVITDDNSRDRYGMPIALPQAQVVVCDAFEYPPVIASEVGNEEYFTYEEDDFLSSDEILYESQRAILNKLRLIQYQKMKFKQSMIALNQRRLKFSGMMNHQNQRQNLASMMLYRPSQKVPNNMLMYPTSSNNNNNWNTVPEIMTSSNNDNMSTMNISIQSNNSEIKNAINIRNNGFNFPKTKNNHNGLLYSNITTKNYDLVDDDSNNSATTYCINEVLEVADRTFENVTDFLFDNGHDFDEIASVNDDDDDDDDNLFHNPITNNYDLKFDEKY